MEPASWPKSGLRDRLDENRYRILVCNNYRHVVSSHVIEFGRSMRIRNHGPLIQRGVNIPDGICISSDTKWIAVSSHARGEVLVYENTLLLDATAPPSAVLRGIVCPHGLRFTPDGVLVSRI